MARTIQVDAERAQSIELQRKRDGEGNETDADGDNCVCPRCGVLNFHPTRGIRSPNKGDEKLFERLCNNEDCRKPVLYILWWEQEQPNKWRMFVRAKAYPLK